MTGATFGDKPLDVVIVPRFGHRVASMERYAAALGANTSDRAVQPRRFPAGRDGTGSRVARDARRWVTQPLNLRRWSADVFHLLDHSDAHLLRVLGGRRTVVTCHDLLLLRAMAGELPYAGRRRWGVRYRWSVAHLDRADAVVCVSEATRQDVLRFLSVDPARLHVVPQAVGAHFVPATPATRAATRSSLAPRAPTLILNVGTGGFYKNTETILRVLARLRSGGLDVAMIRVGVPLAKAERALAGRLGVDDIIEEQGAVSEARLIDIYGAADLLLFPSTGEGFGWPVLEAMSCGLPVVASTIPPLAELVGDAGLLASPTDVDAHVEHAARVANDPTVADRLRHEGHRRASTYGWNRSLTAYARIYREVAAGTEPSSSRVARS